MVWFYLDDERKAPEGMIRIPDYNSMIEILNVCCNYNVEFSISFDHDIGDEYYSGYSIAKYIVENQIPMKNFHIHTANPVGETNIRQLLTHYGYEEIRYL